MEGSAEVAARVAAARNLQQQRFAANGQSDICTNSNCGAKLIEETATPGTSGLALLREAANAMRLSARGYHRVLRIARTLADLDGVDEVARPHIAEALSYRGIIGALSVAA